MSFREKIDMVMEAAVRKPLVEANLKVSHFTGKIADKKGFTMRKIGSSNPGAVVMLQGDEKAILAYAKKYLGADPDAKTISDVQSDVYHPSFGVVLDKDVKEDAEPEVDAELLEVIAEMTDDEFEAFTEFCVEAQLDELSPETLRSYRRKAFKQYKKAGDAMRKSAVIQRRSWDPEPTKRSKDAYDKHAKVRAKRNKGIGSADKRSMARSGYHFKSPIRSNPKAFSLSKKSPQDMRKIKGYGLDHTGKNKLVSPGGKTAYVSSSEIKDYLDRGWKRSK